MRTPIRSLVLLMIAVALVAACGPKPRLTKAQYERQVNHIVQQLSTTLNTTFSSPKLQNPSSLKDAAAVLRSGQKNMERAADELDALNPPERIATVNDELVKGIRDFAASFGAFAQATATGDLAAIQRFSRQVSDETLPAMSEIQKALDDLKAKGFDISKG